MIVDELGLAFFEQARLRCRAPLRRFLARTSPPTDAQWAAVEAHWLGLAATLGDRVGAAGGAAAAQRLGAEWANFEPVLERTVRQAPETAVAAAGGLAEYARFTGLGDGRWLTRLVPVTSGKDRANCIKRLGDIALRRSDHAGAKARYEEAVPIYREVGSKLGEANCIQSLGDIALARSDHAGAKASYEEAVPMFREVGTSWGRRIAS